MTWPTAELDPVRQLRVLAEALPAAGLVEAEIDVPYDVVWSFVSDLERSVPRFDPMVRSVQRVETDDPARGLRIVATSPVLPITTTFDVDLRDGFCWMQSRHYVVGMAAVPTAAGTHYAQVEGLLVPGRLRVVRPLLRAVVSRDVRNLTRILRAPAP